MQAFNLSLARVQTAFYETAFDFTFLHPVHSSIDLCVIFLCTLVDYNTVLNFPLYFRFLLLVLERVEFPPFSFRFER